MFLIPYGDEIHLRQGIASVMIAKIHTRFCTHDDSMIHFIHFGGNGSVLDDYRQIDSGNIHIYLVSYVSVRFFPVHLKQYNATFSINASQLPRFLV